MPKQTYPVDAVAVVLPTGGTGLTAEIDMIGRVIVGIVIPSGWVTATSMTFSGSDTSGGTFINVYDAQGTEYALVVAASRRVIVPPSDMIGNCYLKVRSGTAAAAVDQTGSPTLTLLTRGLA